MHSDPLYANKSQCLQFVFMINHSQYLSIIFKEMIRSRFMKNVIRCVVAVQSELFVFLRRIKVSRYRDFIWLLARACLMGGSLRIAPRIAAMARWLKRA
jgi:hypothetical protein